MATTPKKGAKKSKPKPRRAVAKKAPRHQRKVFIRCAASWREALEQQTATGEVLRVIASSPTELQPVLDTLIANAARLSGATRGHVRQFDGEFYRVVAHYGETPEMIATLRANPLPPSPELPAARALFERQSVHILDVQLETGPHLALTRQMGTRTLLAVPLLREDTPIGSLTIWRDFVEPFTDRQIDLVKTFADQAVIAIENVRLVPRAQGVVGAADGYERDSWRDRQLADRHSAGFRYRC